MRIYIRFLLQNTYTNADKLLAAAEELAHTGECDPDEIYSVAHELEAHVTSFAARVEQRRRRLDLAVLFYTHEKDLSNWVDDLRQELQVRKNVEIRCIQHEAKEWNSFIISKILKYATISDFMNTISVHETPNLKGVLIFYPTL